MSSKIIFIFVKLFRWQSGDKLEKGSIRGRQIGRKKFRKYKLNDSRGDF